MRDGKKLTSIPNKKHFQSELKKLEMSECKESVSPKLDKACIDGDNEKFSEEQTSRFRSSVLTLYLSNERTDIQITVRLLCTKVNDFWCTSRAQRTCQLCLRCVTAMTEENSWSNDWKSTQTLTGRVIK